eukprot:Hpha_TRINITY_DN16889_c5_g3::TRINITY_DN16889_c5_g3_i2::g.148328::m.148328
MRRFVQHEEEGGSYQRARRKRRRHDQDGLFVVLPQRNEAGHDENDTQLRHSQDHEASSDSRAPPLSHLLGLGLFLYGLNVAPVDALEIVRVSFKLGREVLREDSDTADLGDRMGRAAVVSHSGVDREDGRVQVLGKDQGEARRRVVRRNGDGPTVLDRHARSRGKALAAKCHHRLRRLRRVAREAESGVALKDEDLHSGIGVLTLLLPRLRRPSHLVVLGDIECSGPLEGGVLIYGLNVAPVECPEIMHVSFKLGREVLREDSDTADLGDSLGRATVRSHSGVDREGRRVQALVKDQGETRWRVVRRNGNGPTVRDVRARFIPLGKALAAKFLHRLRRTGRVVREAESGVALKDEDLHSGIGVLIRCVRLRRPSNPVVPGDIECSGPLELACRVFATCCAQRDLEEDECEMPHPRVAAEHVYAANLLCSPKIKKVQKL